MIVVDAISYLAIYMRNTMVLKSSLHLVMIGSCDIVTKIFK